MISFFDNEENFVDNQARFKPLCKIIVRFRLNWYVSYSIEFTLFYYLGTWFQKSKEELKAFKERKEQAMAEKMHFVIKGGLKITWKGLTILRKVATSYLDLITDGILLYTIIDVVPFAQSQNTFSDQVAVILLVSIIVPLVTSGITIAFRWPLVVLSTNQWRFLKVSKNTFLIVVLKFFLGLLIFICSPLIPAILTLSNEQAKDERKALIQKHKNNLEQVSVLEEFEALTKYINETRLALLTGKRNELCLELVFQLSIHLSMVFLSRTKYPVENGLQTIFTDNDTEDPSLFLEVTGVQEKITKIQEKYNTAVVFLVFSLVWSFKTAALTAIKIKAETKTFLPFKSKLLLGWRYLTVYMTRISCIVAGIGAIIGVLGIMNHYHAENLPLNPEIWNRYNPSSKLELCILRVAWKLWYSLIPDKV